MSDDNKLTIHHDSDDEGGVEMANMNQDNINDRTIDSTPHPDHEVVRDNDSKHAVERQEVRPLQQQGPREAPRGFRAGLKARTNIKDGFYVEETQAYFWIKYEIPTYVVICLIFIIFFAISVSTVMNQ